MSACVDVTLAQSPISQRSDGYSSPSALQMGLRNENSRSVWASARLKSRAMNGTSTTVSAWYGPSASSTRSRSESQQVSRKSLSPCRGEDLLRSDAANRIPQLLAPLPTSGDRSPEGGVVAARSDLPHLAES